MRFCNRAMAGMRLVSSRFVWFGQSSDIDTWDCESATCQARKITECRFNLVHIDIVGPLPVSEG
jgi:hypothetical protein